MDWQERGFACRLSKIMFVARRAFSSSRLRVRRIKTYGVAKQLVNKPHCWLDKVSFW
jgi:hypothetical protein